ncbi:hypothetical protein [Mycobacterium gastri]|uniref:hypothetical protein n=1 Tax=Mycobacterium gastri TaxID=1777 RepID=UPI0004B777A7|nr:hypothetical protein [Mycobacterium gastri]
MSTACGRQGRARLGYTTPIGVAERKTAITESLPAELESILPAVEELEIELACAPGGVPHEGDG